MIPRLIDLHLMIEQANQMAPLPASLVRLASLVASNQYEVGEVASIIAYDPVLTMRLIRCANSSARGAGENVTTVDDAKRTMKGSLDCYHLREGELWRHSVAAAVAAEVLPDHSKTRIPQETFTAALLHDIGKLVMAQFLAPEILVFLDRARSEGKLNLLDSERQVLEVHHGELGGLVAQRWKMPDTIVRGIIYHHTPEEVDDTICYAVCLSNHVAAAILNRLGGKMAGDCSPRPSVLEALGLPEERIEDLCVDCLARFAVVSSRYNAK